jgi:RNA polymerase sigma-70 factor (ECF subfamily)
MKRSVKSTSEDLDSLLAEEEVDRPEDLGAWVAELYAELKRCARRQLRRESAASTLTPTELVHETYLKLAGQDRARWLNRPQVLAVAARLMRRILVDRYRRRNAGKRPPPQLRVTFSPDLQTPGEDEFEALVVDDALNRLEAFAPELARIVELRWFAGCEVAELAAVTGLSEATIKRRWKLARAWLQKELRPR